MRGEAHPALLGSARYAAREPLCWSAGFTLYELLIVLSIASMLAAIGTSLWQIVQKNRQAAEVNQLLAILALARSEAIRRGQNTVLCPSADGVMCDLPQGELTWWHRGTLLFADANGNGSRDAQEPVLRTTQAVDAGLTIKSRLRRRITFRPTGLSPGSTITLTVCDGRGTEHARYVIVSNAGRARVSSRPPVGSADSVALHCP